MEIARSIQNLDCVVTIYGSQLSDFQWHQDENNDRLIIRTTGIILDFDGHQYVITTRSRLLSCQKIMIYGCTDTSNDKIIYESQLHVLFQSIENNLIILGSLEHDKIETNVFGAVNKKKYYLNDNIGYNITDNPILIPNKKSKYHTIKIDLDRTQKSTNYDVHCCELKYSGSLINDETYLPENYLYQFEINSGRLFNLSGICGAPVFNKKNQLIGTVTHVQNKNISVLPFRVLDNIIKTFLSGSFNYNPPIDFTLPFHFEIKKKNIFVTQDIFIKNKSIKEDDRLIEINKNRLSIKDDEMMIMDPIYKATIPLDLYFRLVSSSSNDSISKLTFLRKKKQFVVELNHSDFYAQSEKKILLTNLQTFNPGCPIPYLQINDLIIVQVTHELLDLMAIHKIEIKNSFIEKFMDGEDGTLEHQLLIIDYLGSINNNLPNIRKKETLECLTIFEINHHKVYTIEDLQNLQLGEFNMFLTSNDNQEYILIG